MLILFGMLEGKGDSHRNHKEPMGRHNEDFIDAKAKNQVDTHVEAKVGEGHPKKTTLASTPYSDGKEEKDNALYDITP